MAEKITHGIYRLNIPLPKNPLKNLNSYIICGSDRNLLIDTGFNLQACLDVMLAELDSLSIDLNKTDIFLTHLHADHVGLALKLASDNAKIYMSDVDTVCRNMMVSPEGRARLKAMNISEGFPEAELTRFMETGFGQSMVAAKQHEFFRLGDGDRLNYGRYSLTCVLTPGHTPGHMCLYSEEEQLMFLGDHVLFDISPNIVRWPDHDNSLRQYLASLDKISHYDIKTALPAHRNVSCTAAERAEELSAHHHLRLREVYGIIQKNPGLSGYQIAGKMQWDIKCDSWADFPLSQKWFALGEALAHIDYLLYDNKVLSVEKAGIRQYYPQLKGPAG